MFPSHPHFRRFSESFEFRWPTTQRKISIEWQTENGDVFFRPRDAPVQVLWHALDAFGKRTPAQILEEALTTNQLRRTFMMLEEEFVFWNRTEGIVQQKGEEYGAAFSLAPSLTWSNEHDFLFEPCDRVADYFSLSSTPPTDFQKARMWNKNYLKGWGSVELSKDSPSVLRQVLQAVFMAYNVPLSATSWGSCFVEESGGTLKLSEYGRIPALLIQTLNTWFAPVLSNRRRVRGFSSWHGGIMEGLPRVYSEELTSHERLEALMFLRDFLRDKLSPEEIKMLLEI